MASFKSLFLLLAALISLASANTVTFVSSDSLARTVYFTPSSGGAIDKHRVDPGTSVTVHFPDGWIGNWYAVVDGRPNVPGMLGEVTFQGFSGLTYFDVSAIVRSEDHSGVHCMWPTSEPKNISGCDEFPCNDAYYMPNDLQTKITGAVDLICTLHSQ